MLQIAGQLLLEAGIEGANRVFTRRAHPVVAGAGLLAAGAACGSIVSLLLPSPILGLGFQPGLSLIISPIASGLALDAFGRYRRARGYHPSYLATFWGGALFAFGMAAARFWLVGRFR